MVIAALMARKTFTIPLSPGTTIGGANTLSFRADLCRFGVAALLTISTGIPMDAAALQELWLNTRDPSFPLYRLRRGLVGCVNTLDDRYAVLAIVCPVLVDPEAMSTIPAAINPPMGPWPRMLIRQNLPPQQLCQGGRSCPVPVHAKSGKPPPHDPASHVFTAMLSPGHEARELFVTSEALRRLSSRSDIRAQQAVAAHPAPAEMPPIVFSYNSCTVHDWYDATKTGTGRSLDKALKADRELLKNEIRTAMDRLMSAAAKANETVAAPATGKPQQPHPAPPAARQPPRQPGQSLATRSASAHPLPLFPSGACQGALHCCRPKPLSAPSCPHHVEAAADEEAEDDPRINSGIRDAYVICTRAPARHMAATGHFGHLSLGPPAARQRCVLLILRPLSHGSGSSQGNTTKCVFQNSRHKCRTAVFLQNVPLGTNYISPPAAPLQQIGHVPLRPNYASSPPTR